MASFLKPPGQPQIRPVRYRTPSPPLRHYVEHHSPAEGKASIDNVSRRGPHTVTAKRNGVQNGRVDALDTSAISIAEDIIWKNAENGRRNTSAMDAFATIALATSPRFSSNSYHILRRSEKCDNKDNRRLDIEYGAGVHDHQTFDGYEGMSERPWKRARSEVPAIKRPIKGSSRPYSSHITSSTPPSSVSAQGYNGAYINLPIASESDSRTHDAELLLNFSRPSFHISASHTSTTKDQSPFTGLDRAKADGTTQLTVDTHVPTYEEFVNGTLQDLHENDAMKADMRNPGERIPKHTAMHRGGAKDIQPTRGDGSHGTYSSEFHPPYAFSPGRVYSDIRVYDRDGSMGKIQLPADDLSAVSGDDHPASTKKRTPSSRGWPKGKPRPRRRELPKEGAVTLPLKMKGGSKHQQRQNRGSGLATYGTAQSQNESITFSHKYLGYNYPTAPFNGFAYDDANRKALAQSTSAVSGSAFGDLHDDNLYPGSRHDYLSPLELIRPRSAPGSTASDTRPANKQEPYFDFYSTRISSTVRAKSVPSDDRGKQISAGPVQYGDDSSAHYPYDFNQTRCAGCAMLQGSVGESTDFEAVSWISCDGCKQWFHVACAGFTEKEAKTVDKYSCRQCYKSCGPTTFVRKSTRAHTAIDYAGLNEGVVKTSSDNPDHPYIKPIKEATVQFLPDNFARLKPELVTREYFEKGEGMKEPVVILASENPRPANSPSTYDALAVEVDFFQMTSPLARTMIKQWFSRGPHETDVPTEGEDKLDMVIPRDLSVRHVAHLYGLEEKVEVIDVKSQGEAGPWNMRKWADYYESKEKRTIRNVISLEISSSKLGKLVKRPRIVREMDLADSVWPPELKAKGDFPKVQLYCLMSVADSFTDFHIDFGGSSVFYHVLKGRKTFLFIPPKPKHLKKYEQWCLSPAQNQTFLPDQTKECIRVDLSAGDTMLIPSGWIHAVWTPEDSLVIGGNYLTRSHYSMQLQIAEIEKNTRVPRKFRYPKFQKVMWYTAIRYLKDDPLPESVIELFNEGQVFCRTMPTYTESAGPRPESLRGTANFHARHYSRFELDGLPDLVRYLQRTALISTGKITDGITVDTKKRVMSSIPKGLGDPVEFIKRLAIWSAWKRGNECIPHWAYPDYVNVDNAQGADDKKISATALKRLEREAALAAKRIAPSRQSLRKQAQEKSVADATGSSTHPVTTPSPPVELMANGRLISSTIEDESGPGIKGEQSMKKPRRQGQNQDMPFGSKPVTTPKSSVLGPKRVACDACRKRRVRCKHKDDVDLLSGSGRATDNIALASQQTDISSVQQATRGQSPNRNRKASDQSPPATPTYHQSTIFFDQLMLGTSDSIPQMTALSSSVHPMTPAESGETQTPDGSSNNKKGRSKACDECRRSKRRCVHDGNGNIDPTKVQEAVEKRAASQQKRARATSDAAGAPSSKKAKQEMENKASPVGPQLQEDTMVESLFPEHEDLAKKHPPHTKSVDPRHVRSDLHSDPMVEIVANVTCNPPFRQQISDNPVGEYTGYIGEKLERDAACGHDQTTEYQLGIAAPIDWGNTDSQQEGLDDEIQLIATSPNHSNSSKSKMALGGRSVRDRQLAHATDNGTRGMEPQTPQRQEDPSATSPLSSPSSSPSNRALSSPPAGDSTTPTSTSAPTSSRRSSRAPKQVQLFSHEQVKGSYLTRDPKPRARSFTQNFNVESNSPETGQRRGSTPNKSSIQNKTRRVSAPEAKVEEGADRPDPRPAEEREKTEEELSLALARELQFGLRRRGVK